MLQSGSRVARFNGPDGQQTDSKQGAAIAREFLERYADQSQDVLAAILTQSRDCIKLVDLDGKLEYFNANGLEAFGFTDPDEVVGNTWRDLWPEENRGYIDTALDAAKQGQTYQFEARCPNRFGEDRWWDVSVSPVAVSHGQITHFLAISRDVTPQTLLRRSEQERREAAEQKASFASDMAREMRHRFKNQLAVIGAIAKLLARHTDSARELASKLEEKLYALAQAQDLLTDSNDQPIPADDAVRRVLAASAEGDQVQVVECPDALLGDEAIQQLALLLNELQTNALKHGALRSPGGRIQLTGSASDDVVTIRWHERCVEPVFAPEQGNGGFQLIRRIGAVGAKQPSIAWDSHGIIVEFHLRIAA